MAGTVQNLGHDFWQPHLAQSSPPTIEPLPEVDEICSRCGTGFLEGSRFCHTCGAAREADPSSASAKASPKWQQLQPADLFRELGLSPVPFAAFLAGLLCLSAAAFAGIFIAVQTVADWESLQYWRIDWLLAAIAAFAAGILLKRD
jgi:hypothetical protein